MQKIRGQGYDGAANMSGAYGGVQALMRQKAPIARYIPCAAHALNLVINDAVKNVTELRNFFDMLAKLYVFFSAISRWNRLQKERTCSITLNLTEATVSNPLVITQSSSDRSSKSICWCHEAACVVVS